MFYRGLWQISSGLKEDPKGSQVAKSQTGVSKMRFFLYSSVSCSQTSSCASKPLMLEYRYMFYEVLLQVSSGLKEDEMDRQDAKYQRGVHNAVFNISRSPAPKPAFVPPSRIYCDISVCSKKALNKSPKDWKRMRIIARAPNVSRVSKVLF